MADDSTRDFLSNLIEDEAWIGGFKLNAGDWQWADGTPFTYKNNLQTECEIELSVTLLGTDHILLIQF